MLLDVRPDHLQIVQDILQKHVPQYEVWAFGSRAKWTAKEYSDLDLCIVSDKPLSFSLLGTLADEFSESDLPYKVDIVDWATTSPSFRKIIERDKVVVQRVNRVKDVGSEWSDTTLGQICTTQGGTIQTGPFGSQLHTSDYTEFGTPVVMPTNIGDGVIVESDIARIGQADVERLSQHKLNIGDIVFSRRGDVTKNALVGKREVGWLCGTGCLKVRMGDESIANAQFISYALRQPDIKAWLIRHAVGATMPNLNTGILSAVPIHLPPLSTQLEIAESLGALDDKIALLRETNTTLEAIAQAIFKSWFVDFDPVRAKMEGREPEGLDAETAALFPDSFEDSEMGEIPKGWRTTSVYDLAEYVNGAAYKAFSPNTERLGLPIIKIAELKAGVTAQTAYSDREMPEKYRIQTGDILFSWSGNPDTSIDTFVWPHGVAWLNQHIFRVVVDDAQQRAFVLQILRHLRPVFAGIARNKQTTGLGHVTIADMKQLLVVKPDKALLGQFFYHVAPIQKRVFENEQQVLSLTELRDTLLPRLMSGKLHIRDVEGAIS